MSAREHAARQVGVRLTPALRDAVSHEQLRMVLLHTRVATLAASLFALMVALYLTAHPLQHLPPSAVWGWLVLKLAVAGARLLLGQAYERRPEPVRRWQRSTLALLALDGLVWGVAGHVLMRESLTVAAVGVAIMDGIACVATFGLQVSLPATAAYAVPILLPVAVGLALRHDEVAMLGGGGQLILLLLLLSTGRNSARRLAAFTLARLQAMALAAEKDAALQLAREQSALRSQFLAKVSHELRTPLHGMLGLSRLLELDTRDREAAHRLQLLQRSGSHLLGLINDLLDVARIDSGRFALLAEDFDLAGLIDPLAEVFALRAADKGLAFQLQWQLPRPCWVHGDGVRLAQVLHNLLGNAVKFTRTGRIVLQVGPGVQHDGVRLAVHDTGAGIGENERSRIFQAFHQAPGADRRPTEGVGLGLTIAREIVAAMGGEIHLRSELGQGSTFSFEARLPAVPAPETEPHALAARPVAGAAAAGVAPPAGAATGCPVARLPALVLVAEDDDVNALIATAFLDSLGVRSERVVDGRQAVERALREHDRPQMVLMDCRMPVMDGTSAAAEIRRAERARGLPRLPILALTATTAEDEVQACLAAGIDEVIAKPFTPERLADAMRSFAALPASQPVPLDQTDSG